MPQANPSAASSRSESSVSLRRQDGPDNDILELYFRDLDGESLMRPSEELEAATRILELRKRYWNALLSYPPFIGPIVEHIDASLSADKKKGLGLSKLRKALEQRHRRPTVESKGAVARGAETLADKLADVDPSCDIADVVAADVEAIAAGEMSSVRLEVRSPRRNSGPFREFVQRIARSRMALNHSRREFAKANLRLVVTMAHRYRRNGRMSFADLIQEGNVGLMTAVDRFDPRRGFRFSTYGSWWIRHAISRALSDKGRAVRLPVHVIELQSKLSRIRREFEHKHQREPFDEELAELAGIPREKVERFGRVLIEQEVPSDAPAEAGRAQGMDALADDAPHADDTMDSKMLDGSLSAALEELRPMEADILRMRFGLDDEPPMTLREIGGIYSLSRERIRQIQERALRKLRRCLESDGFNGAPSSFVELWA